MSEEPTSWATTTILDASSKIMDYRGRTPKKLGMEWGGGSIPAISARNVRMGRIDFSEEHYFGSDALYRRWMSQGDVEKGDSLITTEAPLGKVAAVPDTRRYILSQRTVLLRPKPELLDKAFFTQVLQSPDFQRSLFQGGTGSTAVGIQRKRLERLTIPVPPLGEQRRISAAITDADALIAALERMIVKKNAIKQGMMRQLLTGRARLPGFTEPWSTTTLASLGSFFKGRGVKRDDVNSTGIRCIRYGEIYTDFQDYTAEAKSFVTPEVAATALPLKTGDVLFAGSGETRDEIGKCIAYLGPEPAVAGGDVIVLRGERFNAVYLALLSNSPEVVRQKARAGQGDAVVHIYSQALAAIEVNLPPQAEQDAIARVIVDVDTELGLLRHRLVKAQAIKQGMMQELLTGRTRLPVKEAVA